MRILEKTRDKRTLTAVFCAVLTLLFAGATSALAETPADALIQQSTARAVAVLGERTLSQADKRSQIQELMSSLLDLKRMAIFALGPAARTATPEELDAFVA